jgi:hypothetical protein
MHIRNLATRVEPHQPAIRRYRLGVPPAAVVGALAIGALVLLLQARIDPPVIRPVGPIERRVTHLPKATHADTEGIPVEWQPSA